LGALHLLSAGAATPLEGVEVADLAEEGAGADDGEADPEAPDEAAEDGDDLVPEEGREGDDEEDADGDEPAELEA
jgi:hypothetical protein